MENMHHAAFMHTLLMLIMLMYIQQIFGKKFSFKTLVKLVFFNFYSKPYNTFNSGCESFFYIFCVPAKNKAV